MVNSRKRLFVVLVSVVVVIATAGFWFYLRYTQPHSVVGFSIDRPVIKPGENATLEVIVENFDLKRHFVEYRFKTNPKVSIYEGAERRLRRINSYYTFNHTLEASHGSETNLFVVKATLEEGISSSTYSISLSVYFDGGELEKTWNDLTLKVEE